MHYSMMFLGCNCSPIAFVPLIGIYFIHFMFHSQSIGQPFPDSLLYRQYCKICPHNRVAQDQTLPEYTIVYGENQRRTEKAGLEELRAKAVEKHVETLKGMGMR